MVDLYHGDCLVEQKKIKNNSIDLILTDLPYGNIRNMGGNIKRANWDVKIKTVDIFNIAKRILKQNKKMILFGQQPFTTELINHADGVIKFCYTMIWKKNHFGNQLLSKKAPVKYFEDIVVFSKYYDIYNDSPLRMYFKRVMDFIGLNIPQINAILDNRRAEHVFYITSSQFQLCSENVYNELIAVFGIDEMPDFISYHELEKKKETSIFNLPQGEKIKGDVLEYSKDSKVFHSTQKPVKLLEDIIKTYTNHNDTVVDLTMGGGSTGVACINTGRDFVGIELDDDYYQIAKKRIFHAMKKE